MELMLGWCRLWYHRFPFSFSSVALKVFFFSPGAEHTPRFCPGAQRTLDLQPTLNLIIPNGEGEEEEAAFGWLNSQNGTVLLSGRSRGADHRGRVPGFIRERKPHCVLLLEQVPGTSVQFFGQGWAELPCHKIIAERISVEFRIVSKGALCYSSLQAEGNTSAPGQALLLTS